MAISDFFPDEFSGKLDPGSAEDQNTEDLFSFLPDVLKPDLPDIRMASQEERQDPNFNFGTDPVSPRVNRAARGARTEVGRGFGALPQEGQELFLQELEEEQGGWNMLNGVMDTLNADVAAPAVFIDEMVNDSGNWSKALNRASKVFKGGLPGYTAEESMYSHGDWMRDAGWFDTEDGEHWSLPWVGFVADLVFSPVNWLTLGSGTAMKTTAAGAVGISKARRAAQIAVNPTLGLGAELLGAGKRAGGAAIGVDRLSRLGLPGAQTFGELFLPNFDKIQEAERIARRRIDMGDLAGADRVRMDAKEFIRLNREMVMAREDGHMTAAETVRGLMTNLPNEQRMFFQLFMDQDMKKLENHLRTYYREVSPDGTIDEGVIDEAIARAKELKLEHDRIRLSMKEVGIDQHEVWNHFSPLVFPTSGQSLKWSQKVLADNDSMRKVLDDMNIHISPEQEARGIEQLRQFKDPAEAAAAGIPFEMDVGKSTFKYALQANAKIKTKKMLNTWLTNPEIARPMAVNADVAARSSGKVTDDVTMLSDPMYRKKWEDMGYVLYDPTTLREIPLGNATEEFDSAIDAFKKHADHSSQLFWIPKPFADDLTMSRRLYDDSNAVHRFMGKMQTVQSIWKSYALLSPGYHMRNLHSNLFMNFIAGVTDPKNYMEAMVVQAGGTSNLPMGIRQVVEAAVGRKNGSDVLFTDKNGKMWTVDNLHQTANDRAILSSGLFDQDLPLEMERTLMSGLDTVAKVAMNRHTFTRGAARLQQEAMDAGMSDDDAILNAQIHNAKARNFAASTGADPEEYYYGKRIQSMDRDLPDMAIKLEQSAGGGTEFFRRADVEAGELEGHLYGELENVMHRTFLSGRIPSGDTLKRTISNGRDFRVSGRDGDKVWRDIHPEGTNPVDPKNIMKRAQEVLSRDENFGDWFKEFGEGMSGIVGKENMPEFSNVFAILSGQKLVEQNFAEAAFVMRRMREGLGSGEDWSRENFMKWMSSEPMTVRNAKLGDIQTEDVPTQILGKKAGTGQMGRLFDFYDSAFNDYGIGNLKGGPKTTNFTMNVLHRSRSDFYPFVVTDSVIASTFGFRTGNRFGFAERGNHAQYRYAQHIIAQIAKHLGRSPDEVMAALWADGKAKSYMTRASKEGGEIGLTGTPRNILGSAWPYANVEKWRQGDFLASKIGTWESANEFASVELDRLRDVVRQFDDGPLIDGFTFEEKIKSAKGSAERSDVMAELTDEELGTWPSMQRRYTDPPDPTHNDPNVNILRQDVSPIATSRISGREWLKMETDRRAGRDVAGGSHRTKLIHLTTNDPDWETDAQDIIDALPPQAYARNIEIQALLDQEGGRHADIFPESGIILHPGDSFDHPFVRKRKDGVYPEDGSGGTSTGGAVQWRIASETVKGLKEVFEADIMVTGKDKPYFKQLARDTVELFLEKRRETPDLKAELTVVNDDLNELLRTRFGFVPKKWRGEGALPGTKTLVPSDKTFAIYERRGRLFQDGSDIPHVYGDPDIIDAIHPVKGPTTMAPTTFDVGKIVPELKNEDGTLIPLYHGTNVTAKASVDFWGNLKPPSAKGPKGGEGGFKKFRKDSTGTWVTTDPKFAASYARASGAFSKTGELPVPGTTGDIRHGGAIEVEKDFGRPIGELEEDGLVPSFGNQYSWRSPSAERIVPLYANIKKLWRIPENMKKDYYRAGLFGDGSYKSKFPTLAAAEQWAIVQARRAGADAIDHGGGTYQIVDPKILESALSPGVKGGLFQDPHAIKENLESYRGAIDVRDADGNPLRLYDTEGKAIRNAISTPLQETQYVIHLHRDNHNASTLIHEMGHLFRLDGSLSRKDAQVISEFVGDDASKRVMEREAEEKFARAFEAYIMEGKSPVKGMEDVFRDMSIQLENVYQTMPPENITPEVRSVMDNLFKRVNEHEIAVAATQTVGESGSSIANFSSAAHRIAEKLFGRDNPILKANRVFGRAVENNARGAHWVDRLKKGESDVDAASSVFKYLLDYDEITDFEKRWLRNVIPFYTWMRKAAPLQVQAVFEDPARYSAVPKFMNFVEAFSEDWEGIEGPDYFSESNALRLPILYNEKPLFLVPDLPFQEFNTLGSPIDAIASGMTPFIKGPIEWYPKHAQSLFTDRPIEKYIGEPAKGMLGALGASAKTENLARTFAPTFGKIDRLVTDVKKGEGAKRLASEIGGLRVVPVDEQKIARSKAFQKQDVLRRVKKRLRDEGKIPKESVKKTGVESGDRRRRRSRRRRRRDR